MPRHDDSFGMGALKAGAIASAIAGGYKFAEFAVRLKKLHEVGSENAVFIRLIQRVNLDLRETDRLLRHRDVKHALSRSPEKVAWIERTVASVCDAMEEMGQYTERVGKDLEKGKHVKPRHRIRWVLDEYQKLMHRRMELSMCHNGLLQVLGFLSTLEPLACCQPETEVRKPVRFVQKEERWIQERDGAWVQEGEGGWRQGHDGAWNHGRDELQERYADQIRRRHEAEEVVRARELSPGVTRIERRETRYPAGEEHPGPSPRRYEERREYHDEARTDPSEYGPMPRLRTHVPSSRL